MPTKFMDLAGLKCPQPTLKMTIELHTGLQKGDTLEVVADCPTFENDVKNWCKRNNTVLVWLKAESDGSKRCRVQI